MSRLAFLLIFSLTSALLRSDRERDAILSCLRFYRPRFAALFTCRRCQDNIEMDRTAFRESFRPRLVSINTEKGMLATKIPKDRDKFSYFLNAACGGAWDILKEASEVGRFRMGQSWYLFVGNQSRTFESIVKQLKAIKTRMDMDFKILLESDDGNIQIHELFRRGLNVDLETKHIGNILNKTVVLDSIPSYYESRKNMSGVVVRVGSVAKYPYKTSFYEYMTDPKYRNYDIYSKFHFQLVIKLADIHQFKYKITLSYAWYGNCSSGADGGLAKLLLLDEIDMSGAGGMLRLIGSERVQLYDYIMPYYKFSSCFYFRNPRGVRPDFNEVLKPFARESWMMILYVTGAVCVCNELVYFVETRCGRTSGNRSLFRSLFIVIGAFSQQGLDYIPNHSAGRIIFLHLFFCSLLLYNYYTSSLVSSLISTKPEVLKSIKELLESNLKVGLEPQPYTISYMQNIEKLDRYWEMLNRTKIYENGVPNFFDAPTGIEMVRRGDFAFHTESVTAYPLISYTFDQESICNLAEIELINSDTSLILQKRSHYKKLFQISLRKMWQSGIIRKIHKTWVKSKPECLSSARIISVGINDLFLPFFLLAVGTLFSILILIAEIIWKHFKGSPNLHMTYIN